jgi:hypothetical protein
MAALCVALIALVYLEPAHADDHGAGGAAATIHLGDGPLVHTHPAAPSEHGQQAPDEQGSKPHAHHCAAAHALQMPDAAALTVLQQATLRLGFAREPSLRLHGLIFGHDRPPRAAVDI